MFFGYGSCICLMNVRKCVYVLKVDDIFSFVFISEFNVFFLVVIGFFNDLIYVIWIFNVFIIVIYKILLYIV